MNTNPLFDVTDRGAHVLIALIWALALLGIDYSFIVNAGSILPALSSTTFILAFTAMNIGMCAANAYFQVNVEMSADGLKENATGQPLDNVTLTQKLADLQTQFNSLGKTTPAATST